MEITLSKNIRSEIDRLSDALGLEKNDLINQAILLYLENMRKYAHLKNEFLIWDRLSDEAFLEFEKN